MANGTTQQVELPDEVINEPVMQALMAGSPPATSAKLPEASDSPIGQLIAKNSKVLQQAGFGFYRSQSGDYGVLFNGLRINPQQIQQADQQGNLLEVAPPIEQVEQAVLGDPNANPVLNAKDPSGAALPPSPQNAAPAAPSTPPSGGKVASALFGARKRNVQTGSPTSGPRPGAGRVVNAIMKPVV